MPESLGQKVYLLLGTAPALARLELQSLLRRLAQNPELSLVTDTLVSITLHDVDPSVLLNQSGGIIKCYKEIPLKKPAALIKTIAQNLISLNQANFIISSQIPTQDSHQLASAVKKLLVKAGLDARFRHLPKLSASAGILHPWQEFVVISESNMLKILKVTAVQDISQWSQKDYDRPSPNPRKGMLPPKVARMLINCALPFPLNSSMTLYDPMCGVGTILAEGLALNLNVVGSDIDLHAVDQAKNNLAWFKSTFNPQASFDVFTHNLLDRHGLPPLKPLDAVVFEGYLGPAQLNPEKIPNLVKGLTKFYTGAFKRLNPLLKNDAYSVVALPAFVTDSGVKTLAHLIDSCEKLGYTQTIEPVWYYRPQAQVRRQIIIWQKASSTIK